MSDPLRGRVGRGRIWLDCPYHPPMESSCHPEWFQSPVSSPPAAT